MPQWQISTAQQTRHERVVKDAFFVVAILSPNSRYVLVSWVLFLLPKNLFNVSQFD